MVLPEVIPTTVRKICSIWPPVKEQARKQTYTNMLEQKFAGVQVAVLCLFAPEISTDLSSRVAIKREAVTYK